MTQATGNTEQDERGLLPYPVIIAATKPVICLRALRRQLIWRPILKMCWLQRNMRLFYTTRI